MSKEQKCVCIDGPLDGQEFVYPSLKEVSFTEMYFERREDIFSQRHYYASAVFPTWINDNHDQFATSVSFMPILSSASGPLSFDEQWGVHDIPDEMLNSRHETASQVQFENRTKAKVIRTRDENPNYNIVRYQYFYFVSVNHPIHGTLHLYSVEIRDPNQESEIYIDQEYLSTVNLSKLRRDDGYSKNPISELEAWE